MHSVSKYNQMCQRFTITAFVSLLFLMIPSSAFAHKVNVFAYVEGNEVIAEGYFADGRKCMDSVVEVMDSQGNKLLEGKTDEEGRFAFKVPVHADLLIRLNASTGHQAEYVVPQSDLPADIIAGDSPQEAFASNEASAAAGPEQPETPGGVGTSVPTAMTAVDAATLEEVIDRAVARQVVPLRRAIEEERGRLRFLDIVGGIGYIVGLMGLVAYFRSRRRDN
jgi:nickel transport protein